MAKEEEIVDDIQQGDDDSGPFKASIDASFRFPELEDEEPEKPEDKPADKNPLEAENEALKEALKVQKVLIERSKEQAAPPAPAWQPQPQIPHGSVTEEQLNDLFLTAPARAAQIIADRAVAERERNFNSRFESFASSAAAAAESAARAVYPEIFEYPEDVARAKAAMSPEALAAPQVWKEIAEWVRGKNLDAIVEKRLKAKSDAALEEARKVEARNATTAARTGRRAAATVEPGQDKTYGLTEAQRRACEVGGISFKDYAFAIRGGR